MLPEELKDYRAGYKARLEALARRYPHSEPILRALRQLDLEEILKKKPSWVQLLS